MTQHGDYLRRLRDSVHELQVLIDEAISENDRVEDAVSDAMHKSRRSLRSVADLRDDEDQARAEHHLLRDGA